MPKDRQFEVLQDECVHVYTPTRTRVLVMECGRDDVPVHMCPSTLCTRVIIDYVLGDYQYYVHVFSCVSKRTRVPRK